MTCSESDFLVGLLVGGGIGVVSHFVAYLWVYWRTR